MEKNHDLIMSAESSLVIFISDKITRGDPLVDINAFTELSKGEKILSKKNCICVFKSSIHHDQDYLPKPSAGEKIIKLRSKFYIDLDIILKSNNEYMDKFNILESFDNPTEKLSAKFDEKFSSLRIIPNIPLVPSPAYPFPQRVIPIFGKIKDSFLAKDTYFKISCEKLNFKTVAQTSGEFVICIDDEVVNTATILNTDKTKFQFEVQVEKISFEDAKMQITKFNDLTVEIPISKSYNLGIITEAI